MPLEEDELLDEVELDELLLLELLLLELEDELDVLLDEELDEAEGSPPQPANWLAKKRTPA